MGNELETVANALETVGNEIRNNFMNRICRKQNTRSPYGDLVFPLMGAIAPIRGKNLKAK